MSAVKPAVLAAFSSAPAAIRACMHSTGQ
jgi:hypothetical protein